MFFSPEPAQIPLSAAQLAHLAPVTVLNEDDEYAGFATMTQAVAAGLNSAYITLNENQAGDATHDFSATSLRGNGNRYACDPGSMAQINCGTVADIELTSCSLKSDHIRNSTLRGCDFTSQLPENSPTEISDSVINGGRVTGSIILLPGAQVDADFFASFTRNPDGSYTTPQGGNVVDRRGVVRSEQTQAALRAGGVLNRPLVLGTFGGYNNGFSDGSALAQSFWFEPNAPLAASGLQLLFGNFSLGSSYAGGTINPGQLPGQNPITVKASIYNGEDLFPFTFNGGQPSARILPGMTVLTDRLPRFMKPGGGATVLQVSVAVDTIGQKWPLGITSRNSAAGDAIGQSFNNGPALSYHPIAVMGDLNRSRPYGSVALVGDSIQVGGGDEVNDLGYAARGLNAAGICWTRMATYGALLDTYTRLDKLAVALPTISGVEHVLCNLGVNNMLDLLNSGLPAMKARYLNLWAALGASGAKVHQATITPYGTNDASLVLLKAQLNDWIRSVPAGLTSCVDAARLAETANNSNIWRPGYSNDGLHPNQTGAAALALAVKPSTFLL